MNVNNFHQKFTKSIYGQRLLLTMTRLTNETALSGMSQRYIIPMISVTIIATVNVTLNAMRKWKPISKNVITKMAAKQNRFYRE